MQINTKKTTIMENKHYNGWSNYATWLVNVNIISDIRWDDYEDEVSAPTVQELVEHIVFGESESSNEDQLIVDYARCFLYDVNYQELAEAINDDLKN